MRIAIVCSLKDLAGMNIKQNLMEHFGFSETEEEFDGSKICLNRDLDVRLYILQQETTNHDNIDKEIEADIFIYATRHRSASGIPSLSVHCTGNWDKAELGGKDGMLCISPQNFLKDAMIYLQQNYAKHPELEHFDIVQECTHHGPFMEKPLMFIEIGSTEKEWQIPEAGRFIAETIIYLIKNADGVNNKGYQCAVGIGGTHTLSNFKKIIINHDIAISHVCPKYMLDHLTKELVEQAIGKSMRKANLVILDWKGLGQNKERIVEFLKEIDITIKRTKEF